MTSLSELPSSYANNNLNRAIYHSQIDKMPSDETSFHTSVRHGVENCAKFLGLIGNVAIARLPYNFAKTNTENPIGQKILGSVYVAANFVGFGAVTAGLLYRQVKEFLKPIPKQEEPLYHENLSKNTQRAIWTGSALISTIAQIPLAATSYLYNEGNERIAFPFLIMSSNISLPFESLKLTFERIALEQNYNKFEKGLRSLQDSLAQNIDRFKHAFVSFPPSVQEDIAKALESIRTSNDVNEKKIAHYLELLTLSPHLENQPEETTAQAFGQKICMGIGFLGSIALLIHYGVLGAKFGDILYNGPNSNDSASSTENESSIGQTVLEGTFAFLSVFSNFYLLINNITNASRSIFNTTYRYIFGQNEKKISAHLRPQTTSCLKWISSAIGLLNFAAPIQFSYDFFSGNMRTFLVIFAPVGNIFFLTPAILNESDEILINYLRNHGTPEEKEKLTLSSEFGHFQKLVEKASLLDFAKALHSWNAHLSENWKGKWTSLPSIENLSAYIQGLNFSSQRSDSDGSDSATRPLLLQCF